MVLISSPIPSAFSQTHKKRSDQLYQICLNELRNNATSLKQCVAEKNESGARAELHQMVSTAKIIFNSSLTAKIEALQQLVREAAWGADLDVLFAEVVSTLNNARRQYQLFLQADNILIYGSDREEKKMILDDLANQSKYHKVKELPHYADLDVEIRELRFDRTLVIGPSEDTDLTLQIEQLAQNLDIKEIHYTSELYSIQSTNSKSMDSNEREKKY